MIASTDPDGDTHHHPPANASSNDDNTEASCMSVTEVVVFQAVHQVWSAQYEQGDV